MKEDLFRQFAVVILDEGLTWGTLVAVERVPMLEYAARGFARLLAPGGL